MRVCKPSTPVSVFVLRHENTSFVCSIGGKSGAEEGQQKPGIISTSEPFHFPIGGRFYMICELLRSGSDMFFIFGAGFIQKRKRR